MSAISTKLRQWKADDGRAGLTYWCQGCNEAHGIRTAGPGAWGWNGDAERPVFTPSVLTTWPDRSVNPPKEHRCHTFVGCNGAQPGQVIFLNDCTHDLRGVYPLPDLPEWLRS